MGEGVKCMHLHRLSRGSGSSLVLKGQNSVYVFMKYHAMCAHTLT